jgi:cytoskeletal protein RodZ
LSKIEEKTKIKKEFIKAIEEENWPNLPEYTVVLGFVKSVAQYLELNEKSVTALLRRDFPQKKEMINPKPDIADKFVWTPKLTFIVGIAVVIIGIFTYLGLAYVKFVSPPSLEIIAPKEEEVVKTKNLKVAGKTDTDAVIKVNNQLILVDEDGNFEGEIQIVTETAEIEFKAISRSGKERVIKRRIRVEL